MHDQLAELQGLRNELATCLRGPRESRRSAADQVRVQIDRVRDELDAAAERLETKAETLAAGGQDVPAAEAAVAARAIRTALDADQDDDDQAAAADVDPVPPGPFDPSAATMPAVLEHLEGADEQEVTRVLDAEAAGKKRKTLLEQRDALLESARARDDQAPSDPTATGGADTGLRTTQAPAAPETRGA